MKKNDLILLIAVASYSYLFYKQIPGINFLLFSLLIIGLLGYKAPDNSRNFSWIATAIGSIVSGFFVMWYGNSLSVTANLVSLTALAAFSLNPQSSFIVAALNSVYSYISSIPFMVIDYFERKRKNFEKNKNPLYVKLLVMGVPLFVTIIFFMMYQSANPIFYNLTKGLNFNFISWSWISFTMFGFILLYGVVYQRALPGLVQKDINATNTFNFGNLINYEETWIGRILSINNELLSGIILFSLLNLLILFVNITDISYLIGGLKLPEGMTYSQFVHQGTGTIILSVISAIIIILFYFRGHLNFKIKNNGLKILTYIWILQNILMIFSTTLKNQLYIQEYGLTYKRIGVYIYLLLTVIGLVTTFIKVYNIKRTIYLLRKNTWAFYTVLIIATAINWNQVVTNYNIKHSKNLDMDYLIRLNYLNIPTLLNIFPSTNLNELPQGLKSKIESLKFEYENTAWKSWSYHKQKVYSEIKNKFKK